MDFIGTRKCNNAARSGGLNDTRASSRRFTRDLGGANKLATTLAFSGGALTDSGNGLASGVFVAGQRLNVQGLATGNRQYIMGTVAAGSIALTPAPADNASGGASVNIHTVDC